MSSFFFFNDTATTEIYTLSLHDALPIYAARVIEDAGFTVYDDLMHGFGGGYFPPVLGSKSRPAGPDRKSTRLNSSHLVISYAVFCLKKKKNSSKHPHREPILCMRITSNL